MIELIVCASLQVSMPTPGAGDQQQIHPARVLQVECTTKDGKTFLLISKEELERK